MCLATRYTERCRKRIGYKIVARGEEKLYTGLIPHARRVALPIGQWVSDTETGEILGADDGFLYPTGFHILTKKEDATRLLRQEIAGNTNRVLVKVRFRKQVAYGKVAWCYWNYDVDRGTDTVVAREIMNLGEVD